MIKITADLSCDIPHPWDPPTVEIPPDTPDVGLFIKDWMLQNGWSLDAYRSSRPRMLCPSCTYKRLLDEGYDGVFL